MIHNADGGQVEQCGNGARCFARYVADKGLARGDSIRVQTLSGVIEPRPYPDGRVTVDMGRPIFDVAQVPFVAAGLSPHKQGDWQQWHLALGTHADSDIVAVAVLSMGNPHAVLEVPDVDHAPVAVQGPLIERHSRFPQRVNAGFMEIRERGRIRLRVWERGAGETLPAAPGPVPRWWRNPAGQAGRAGGRHTRGGLLTIEWAGGDAPVFMTGPAVTVFEGEIELQD